MKFEFHSIYEHILFAKPVSHTYASRRTLPIVLYVYRVLCLSVCL